MLALTALLRENRNTDSRDSLHATTTETGPV